MTLCMHFSTSLHVAATSEWHSACLCPKERWLPQRMGLGSCTSLWPMKCKACSLHPRAAAYSHPIASAPDSALDVQDFQGTNAGTFTAVATPMMATPVTMPMTTTTRVIMTVTAAMALTALSTTAATCGEPGLISMSSSAGCRGRQLQQSRVGPMLQSILPAKQAASPKVSSIMISISNSTATTAAWLGKMIGPDYLMQDIGISNEPLRL